MAEKLMTKEEAVMNHVQKVLSLVEQGKELPVLPKGVTVKDLPENTKMLYQLKQGEVPKDMEKLSR